MIKKNISFKINKKISNKRIDIILKKKIKNISRNKIQKIIKNNKVSINNRIIKKPHKKTKKGDLIKIKKFNKNIIYKSNKNIKLHKIYEDIDLLIINKENNIVVHPGSGNINNTLMNTLMYYYPDTYKKVPRCGIIHRLDKNTTGLLIIAKNIKTYEKLIFYMKKRKIKRKYISLVWGKLASNGYINKPILRHKFQRKIMSINKYGKKAITYFKIIEKFSFCTLLKINLGTGRTHQIRVHMNYIKHPIIGEKIYTRKNIFKNINISKKIKKKIDNFKRQALHAYSLEFKHPKKKNKIIINSNLPRDMLNLINKFRLDKIKN